MATAVTKTITPSPGPNATTVASIAAGALASKTTKPRTRKARDDGQPRSHFAEAVAILCVGFSVFLITAMATYRVAYQPGVGGENICGWIGNLLARACFVLLGKAAYLPAMFCVIWSVILFLRGRIDAAWVKMFGVAVLTIAIAVILEHRLPFDRSKGDPRGGLLGAAIQPYISHGFGVFGTYIILAVVGAIAFTMATDYAFVPIVRESLAGLKRAGSEVASRAAEAREARTWGGRLRAFMPFVKDSRKNEVPLQQIGRFDIKETPVKPAAELVINAPTPPAVALREDPIPPIKLDPKADDEKVKDTEKASAAKKKDPKTDASKDKDIVQAKLPFPAIPYKLPEPKLLDESKKTNNAAHADDVRGLAQRIEEVLKSFGVQVGVVGASRGPAVTLFELEMGEGVTVNLLTARRHDLAIRLKSGGVRFVYPIPGKSTVGVEIPNGKREFVRLRDLVDEVAPTKVKAAVPLYLGRDVMNRAVVEDLSEMPHLLIAGQTGSGKSACLNAILCSVLLAREPEEVKLILIDPKQVEFTKYDGIPHLMCPIVTVARKVPIVLDWVIAEMEERYLLLSQAGVRKIGDFNAMSKRDLKDRLGENYDPEETRLRLPYLVVVVDEMNDLMIQAKKDMEDRITRIAQKSRAVGIHLILATQRPSVNVITGTIKANLPTRIAFQTAQSNDSRVILDQNGAEDLLGKGDFLYKPPGTDKFVRAQGTWVGDDEIDRLVKHAKLHGEPKYDIRLIQIKESNDDENEDGHDDAPLQQNEPAFAGGWKDELFDRAVEETIESNRAAASHLQRAFAIGYNRATRILDAMAQLGIVSQYEGSKVRRILFTKEEWSARKSELLLGPKRVQNAAQGDAAAGA